MANILDKYRVAQQDAQPTIESLPGEPYQAFEVATGPQRRLDLRPGFDAWRIVSYGYLTDVIHAAGVMVGISFSVPKLHVEIRGRNLQELVNLLREERIVAIREFVTTRHVPPGPGEPCIESMRIVVPGKIGKTAPEAAKEGH